MSTTTDNTYAAARAEFDRKYRSENFEKYDHGEYYVAHDWDRCEAYILTPSGEVEWVGWCEDVTGDAYIDDMVEDLRAQAEKAEQEARHAGDEQPKATRGDDAIADLSQTPEGLTDAQLDARFAAAKVLAETHKISVGSILTDWSPVHLARFEERHAAPRLSDDARRLVEDRILAAVDHCITEWDVEPSAVLEILQQLARDEADFQRDLQPTADDARRAEIGAVLDKYARD